MVRRLTTIVTVLTAMFALLLFVAVPALAHHRDEHTRGAVAEGAQEGDEAETGSATEDDDDNAHPSGNDRETNDGPDDDVQGRSASEPDDNGSGPERDHNGTDKTGGPGGADLEDQDGNNGCGNDDDFEDDNEGWCGKPQTSDDELATGEETSDTDSDESGADATTDAEVGGDLAGDDVLGLRFRGSPETGGDTVRAVPAVRAARARGAILPFTGSDAWGFVFMALGLVAGGYLMLRMKRT